MSVYSNQTISHRFARVFTPHSFSLSHEVKAVLAALAVWAVLLGIIAIQHPEKAGLHSGTNLQNTSTELSDVDHIHVPRQHY